MFHNNRLITDKPVNSQNFNFTRCYFVMFAYSETMIVSIEHSKPHSKYKYNKYIQQHITVGQYLLLAD